MLFSCTEMKRCGYPAAERSCNCEIWKALRIGQIEDMDAAAFPHADRLLVDSYVQGLRGGSGKRIAMDLLQKLDVSRLIIAGGICRDNVKEILALQLTALMSPVHWRPMAKRIRKKCARL